MTRLFDLLYHQLNNFPSPKALNGRNGHGEWDSYSTEQVVSMAERAASGNGHGYFIKSPWVSSDILLILAFGLSPSERGLVRNDQGAIWQFPGDYRQKIRALALQLQKDQANEVD